MNERELLTVLDRLTVAVERLTEEVLRIRIELTREGIARGRGYQATEVPP